MNFPISLNEEDSSVMFATCTINRELDIISADEKFYTLIENGNYYSFDRLVHEDDRHNFFDFLGNSKVHDSIIVKLLCLNSFYRWFVLTKEKQTDNEIGLSLKDILVQVKKYSLYYNNTCKYRAMLNMINERLFDYNFDTDMLCIYSYSNDVSQIIEKDTLTEWQNRMMRLGYIEKSQEGVFNSFCDAIRNGMENFSFTIKCSVFSKSERKDNLMFKGQTVSDAFSKRIVVGVISEISGKISQKSYSVEGVVNSIDEFTGLLNKKSVTDHIVSEIDLCNKTGEEKRMFLVIIDIDDFKSVNDTYGHFFGDEVILEVSNMLKKYIGDKGIVGRIGGDEFIALVTGVNNEPELKNIIHDMREELKKSIAKKQPDYLATVSVGVAEYPAVAREYQQLFKIADASLYIAKEKGKDRYIFYKEELHGEIVRNRTKGIKITTGTEFMKPIEKGSMVYDIISSLFEHKKAAVVPALKMLMDFLNIHGIAIYGGDELKGELYLGRYSKEIPYADYLRDEKYALLFDDHGINLINNVSALAIDYYNQYKLFNSSNICSSLQVIIRRDNEIKGLITFDTFGNNRRKWSQDDINTVYMVVRAISDVCK